jgi:hypothetical protein
MDRGDLWDITPARWRELYEGPGSGYPSISELARRFGTVPKTMRGYLRRAGCNLRSVGQQITIEVKLRPEGMRRGQGRIPPKGIYPQQFTRPDGTSILAGKRKTKAWRKQKSESMMLRAEVPCAWCGKTLSRRPSEIRGPWQYCSLPEHGQHRSFMAHHGPEDARPLIVEALRIRLGSGRPTYEHLAEIGRAIGANDAEIREVLTLAAAA